VNITSTAAIAALVCIVGMVTAAVLLATGDTSLDRLAVLVAVVASIVPGLIGLLRADQAAAQTNGSLDARIGDAVQEALKIRRHTDRAVVTSPTPDEGAIPPVEP
jgi:hypothetical protein